MIISPPLVVSLLSLAQPGAQPAPAPTQVQDIPEMQEDSDEEIVYGWSGSLAIGASVSDGNTDIQRASVTADAVNRRQQDRTTFGFSWNYGEEDDVLTQRRTFGRAQYDYFLTERSYALVDGSGQSDSQAALDFRGTAGAGYGYQFVEKEKLQFGGEIGAAYISEDLAMLPREEFIAARLAYDAYWQATDTVEFEQFMKLYPSLEDKDDIFGQLDSRVKLAVSESMFAQAQWIFDWNNTPSPGRERADHLFLIGVGWSF